MENFDVKKRSRKYTSRLLLWHWQVYSRKPHISIVYTLLYAMYRTLRIRLEESVLCMYSWTPQAHTISKTRLDNCTVRIDVSRWRHLYGADMCTAEDLWKFSMSVESIQTDMCTYACWTDIFTAGPRNGKCIYRCVQHVGRYCRSVKTYQYTVPTIRTAAFIQKITQIIYNWKEISYVLIYRRFMAFLQV